MGENRASFLGGMLLVVCAAILSCYLAVTSIHTRVKNRDNGYQSVYATITEIVGTDVENKMATVQYRVNNNYYTGTVKCSEYNNVDDFLKIGYKKDNPEIVTQFEYTPSIGDILFYSIPGLLAIAFLIYYFYKSYQLSKNSTKEPLVLVGYSRGHLVFKDTTRKSTSKFLLVKCVLS